MKSCCRHAAVRAVRADCCSPLRQARRACISLTRLERIRRRRRCSGMLLRKHVQGAKIAAVSQPAVERMLTIELDTTDEMGVPCKKHLICELMGKHSNVILCGEDNRIIDALRRVDGDLSGKRQVLPVCFTACRPHRTSTTVHGFRHRTCRRRIAGGRRADARPLAAQSASGFFAAALP